jgi:hypothetical protein
MIFGGFPTPMPSHLWAAPVTDSAAAVSPQPAADNPSDLERRIAAFESAAPSDDFDAASWFWMILLGVALPVLLLVIGWRV